MDNPRVNLTTPDQKRNIRAWLKALRSGRYKQTQGKLKDKNGYCCLGVACDVFRKAKKRQGEVFEWYVDDEKNIDGDEYFLDTGSSLPDDVAMWLGLSDDPLLLVGDMVGEITSSTANDERRYRFKRIAALIERTYLGRAHRARRS